MNRTPQRLSELLVALVIAGLAFGCAPGENASPDANSQKTASDFTPADKYTTVRLTTDLPLSEAQKTMIPLMIEAADQMDRVFWKQAYGDRDALLEQVEGTPLEQSVQINYGPWDRLDGNAPFVPGVGAKPDGANFYPPDITKEELSQAVAEAKVGDPDRAAALTSLYTVVRRGENGLTTIPYSEEYATEFGKAAAKIREAAGHAEQESLKRYLELRADALESNEYFESDLAWMEMKDNTLDFVVGPIETYEDQLFGYRSAAEAYVLVKDMSWSERLSRYADFLPQLQRDLPVPAEFKTETPGSDSELNAYDVVYYAGDCNSGSKTIAINLPNDERVQLQRGTRRLQLKNAVRAKFEKILLPITQELIDPSQRDQVVFDAFFGNTMFHEVAHGLGIKNTINGKGTVREALQEQASAIEEGKADVLGLFMVTQLHNAGEELDSTLEQNYVTFIASVFRSIRFGASSAHGRANLLRFNFFKELGAFTRDSTTGTYRVDASKMAEAVNALSEKLLRLQGEGDYEGVKAFVEQYGSIGPELEGDLDRLSKAGIPVDVVFEQGASVLGL